MNPLPPDDHDPTADVPQPGVDGDPDAPGEAGRDDDGDLDRIRERIETMVGLDPADVADPGAAIAEALGELLERAEVDR